MLTGTELAAPSQLGQIPDDPGGTHGASRLERGDVPGVPARRISGHGSTRAVQHLEHPLHLELPHAPMFANEQLLVQLISGP